jgi:hypothetical protein
MTTKLRRDALNAFADECLKKGLLMEAGWVGLQLACIPPNAPQVQLDEMRLAFFAGAQHLWGTINNVLDRESEPTDDDVLRLRQINDELNRFIKDYEKRHGLS